jgi:hypothetical protein
MYHAISRAYAAGMRKKKSVHSEDENSDPPPPKGNQTTSSSPSGPSQLDASKSAATNSGV